MITKIFGCGKNLPLQSLSPVTDNQRKYSCLFDIELTFAAPIPCLLNPYLKGHKSPGQGQAKTKMI